MKVQPKVVIISIAAVAIICLVVIGVFIKTSSDPVAVNSPGGHMPPKAAHGVASKRVSAEDIAGVWDGQDQDGRRLRFVFRVGDGEIQGRQFRPDGREPDALGTCDVNGDGLRVYQFPNDRLRTSELTWGGDMKAWWFLTNTILSDDLAMIVIAAPLGTRSRLVVARESDWDAKSGNPDALVMFSEGPITRDPPHSNYEACPEHLGKAKLIVKDDRLPKFTYRMKRVADR